MNGAEVTSIASRLKWGVGAFGTWVAISSVLPAVGLAYVGEGSIFLLPLVLQGVLGAGLHAVCFVTLPARALRSWWVAISLTVAAVAGGILIAAIYIGTSISFFVEGGAIILGIYALLCAVPAFLLRKRFALISGTRGPTHAF